jgi:hypothetical protein
MSVKGGNVGFLCEGRKGRPDAPAAAARRNYLQFAQSDQQFVEWPAASENPRAKLAIAAGQHRWDLACQLGGSLMRKLTTPNYATAHARSDLHSDLEFKGVRGWLLALCLMLTVIGPAIAVCLMVFEYTSAEPLFRESPARQTAALGSLLLSGCSVVFGAYAGLRLWRVLPNAVRTAKYALLFGLAVDVVTTAFEAAAAQVPSHRLLFHVELGLVPTLIFFTVCFTYLNQSKRVYTTYGPHSAGA